MSDTATNGQTNATADAANRAAPVPDDELARYGAMAQRLADEKGERVYVLRGEPRDCCGGERIPYAVVESQADGWEKNPGHHLFFKEPSYNPPRE